MIRIVTDSTCDLPDGELAQLAIHVVPIHLFFGSEEHQEGVTLSYAEFFRKVDALGIVPKTSRPAPGEFQAQQAMDCRRTFICRLATSLVTNLGIGTLGVVVYPVDS